MSRSSILATSNIIAKKLFGKNETEVLLLKYLISNLPAAVGRTVRSKPKAQQQRRKLHSLPIQTVLRSQCLLYLLSLILTLFPTLVTLCECLILAAKPCKKEVDHIFKKKKMISSKLTLRCKQQLHYLKSHRNQLKFFLYYPHRSQILRV